MNANLGPPGTCAPSRPIFGPSLPVHAGCRPPYDPYHDFPALPLGRGAFNFTGLLIGPGDATVRQLKSASGAQIVTCDAGGYLDSRCGGRSALYDAEQLDSIALVRGTPQTRVLTGTRVCLAHG
jgi:hypothetical protein